MVLFKYIPEFSQVLISTLAKKISVQMGLASFSTHTVRLWNDRETGKYYCASSTAIPMKGRKKGLL